MSFIAGNGREITCVGWSQEKYDALLAAYRRGNTMSVAAGVAGIRHASLKTAYDAGERMVKWNGILPTEERNREKQYLDYQSIYEDIISACAGYEDMLKTAILSDIAEGKSVGSTAIKMLEKINPAAYVDVVHREVAKELEDTLVGVRAVLGDDAYHRVLEYLRATGTRQRLTGGR